MKLKLKKGQVLEGHSYGSSMHYFFGREGDAGKLRVFNLHSAGMRFNMFVPQSEWKHWGIKIAKFYYLKRPTPLANVTLSSISDFRKIKCGESVWVAYEDLKNEFDCENVFSNYSVSVDHRRRYAILSGKCILHNYVFNIGDASEIDDISKIESIGYREYIYVSIEQCIEHYLEKSPERFSQFRRFLKIEYEEKELDLLEGIKSKLTPTEWKYINGEAKIRNQKEFQAWRKWQVWRSKNLKK
jgi:hypothetical protein